MDYTDRFLAQTPKDGLWVLARVDHPCDHHAARLDGVKDAIGKMRNEQPAVIVMEAWSALGKAAKLFQGYLQMLEEDRPPAFLIVLVVGKRSLNVEVSRKKQNQLARAALTAPPSRRDFTASQVATWVGSFR